MATMPLDRGDVNVMRAIGYLRSGELSLIRRQHPLKRVMDCVQVYTRR